MTMRQLLLLLAAVVTAAAHAQCCDGAASCCAKSAATCCADSSLAGDTLTVDTVVKVQSADRTDATVSLQWPVAGPGRLVVALRKHINSELAAASRREEYNRRGRVVDVDEPVFKGNLTDPSEVAGYYARALFAQLKDEASEFDDEALAQLTFSREIGLEKSWESSRYVTYLTHSYSYTGGAHGLVAWSGRTFDKITAQPLTLYIDPAYATDATLQALLRDGLQRYFDEAEGTDSVDLASRLFVDDINAIPLPVTDLWLSAEGVVFLYQSYEIAPYAAGHPTFAVPMDALRPFLNKQ